MDFAKTFARNERDLVSHPTNLNQEDKKMGWSDDELNEYIDAIADRFDEYPFTMLDGLTIAKMIRESKPKIQGGKDGNNNG